MGSKSNKVFIRDRKGDDAQRRPRGESRVKTEEGCGHKPRMPEAARSWKGQAGEPCPPEPPKGADTSRYLDF